MKIIDRKDFTIRSASAFSGYRWPADVILMGVRWYLRHPLSCTSVMELLAERGIDVSNRSVLGWVQAFGPQRAAEARKHRHPLGRRWHTDEMFFFRGKDKWLLDGKTPRGRRSAMLMTCSNSSGSCSQPCEPWRVSEWTSSSRTCGYGTNSRC